MNIPAEVITVIISALIAGGAGYISVLMGRRKLQADATQVIQQAASGVIIDLEKRVEELNAEVCTLRVFREQVGELTSQITPLRNEISELKFQIRGHAIEISRLQTQLIDAQALIRSLEQENAKLRAVK